MESDKFKDPNLQLLKWKNNQNLADYVNQLVEMDGNPTYMLDQGKEFKVQLRVDESIAPAKFKRDPLVPGGYKANSLTIRAMKKDVFVLDTSMTELEEIYHCQKCPHSYDLQFWQYCPYCGTSPCS
jgi:hypothetical protein